MNSKKITITGPFTDENIVFLMNAVRSCEQQHSEGCFTFQVDNFGPEKTVEEAKQWIKDNFPAVKEVPVEIEVYEKK